MEEYQKYLYEYRSDLVSEINSTARERLNKIFFTSLSIMIISYFSQNIYACEIAFLSIILITIENILYEVSTRYLLINTDLNILDQEDKKSLKKYEIFAIISQVIEVISIIFMTLSFMALII